MRFQHFLGWVDPKHLLWSLPTCGWKLLTQPFQLATHCLFLKGPKGEVWVMPSPHPRSSCHCWVTAERQSQWSVGAQHCRGHTVMQSWTKCSITSKRHQPHENTRPAVGLAGEELRPPWVTCSQELARDSGPGQAPHPCVLGSHSAHEVLLTSPHVPIRGRPTE